LRQRREYAEIYRHYQKDIRRRARQPLGRIRQFFFASQVYSGVKTQAHFSKIVKDALNQFIREKINDRLNSALNDVRDQEPEETEEAERYKIMG